MGTYHLIDGCKVRVFYRGNAKTCGRCHKTARECPGEAVARNCAVGEGARVFLSDHMKKLWEEIGFVPTTFELDDEEKTVDDVEQAVKDALIIDKTSFTPTTMRQVPNARDVENFDGLIIRNLPLNLDEKDALPFLINHGLPDDYPANKIKIN